jgi:chromosome partitioning protein
MAIYVFAGAKGGITKTVGTMYSATVLATRYGLDVLVIDCDPQGSALRWSKQAKKANDPLPFTVIAGSMATIEHDDDERLDDDYDVVIIDTPPGNSDLIDTAIDTSDLAFICMTPANDDLQQAKRLAQNVGDNEYGILIGRADMRANYWKDARAALAERGLTVFDNVINQKDTYTKALGTTPTNLEAYSSLWEEVFSDWPELAPAAK